MTGVFASSLVLLAVSAAPVVQEDEEKPVVVRSKVFGKVYETGFYEGAFSFPPHWDEDESNPPVSARKAIRLAKEKRDRLIQKPKGFTWRLHELSLKTDGYGWAWFVTYKAITEGAPETDENRITMIVLMNESILDFEGEESFAPAAPEPPVPVEEVRPARKKSKSTNSTTNSARRETD